VRGWLRTGVGDREGMVGGDLVVGVGFMRLGSGTVVAHGSGDTFGERGFRRDGISVIGSEIRGHFLQIIFTGRLTPLTVTGIIRGCRGNSTKQLFDNRIG
jgi:hypothetical protein